MLENAAKTRAGTALALSGITRYALIERDRAQESARVANSRQLAALSVSERNNRLDRSLLLAVEALRAENTFEAREILYNLLQDRPRLTSFLHINQGSVSVESVAFSPDGKTIAAGYRVVVGVDGVVVWDVAARKRLADDPLPVGYVTGVAFCPDGRTLAAGYGVVGDGGGGVVVWDVAARKRLADDPLPVKEGDVQSVAFSPDGRTIAAGYGVGGFDVPSGGVVVWDVAARKRLADDPLPVKEGDVQSVAFSPDGKTIAAGYRRGDGGVVVRDVAARKRLADDPLPVKEWVQSVAFSPDGKTVAAACDVRGVVFLDVDLESWQCIAGRIANRNFTWDEWRQYFPDESYHRTFPDLPEGPGVAEARRGHESAPPGSPPRAGTEKAQR